MEPDFTNVVRILAVASEQSLIQFCKESGTVDAILGSRHSHDIGDSIIFLRFTRLSSIYDLKRRSKTSKLGGRSVLVETVVDSPLLQEQCRKICKMPERSAGCSSYCGDRTGTPSDRENRRFSFPNRPMSAPASRLASADLWRFSGPRPNLGHLRCSPLKLLNLQSMATPRPSSHRAATPNEYIVSTIDGLPSPLAKSPTVFKNSFKSEKAFAPRASVFSPQLLYTTSNASQYSNPDPLKRTLSSPRTTKVASVRNATQGPLSTGSARFKLGSRPGSGLHRLKEELSEAKEKYARSLEKVQNYLDQIEKKHGTHRS